MKETLTVGNHISCIIEKVELNYILASFTCHGVTYRGVLINEDCSTVRRSIPESNLNDKIITVEPVREDARDRLLRNKKTYGPEYGTRVLRSNDPISRNLRTKTSCVLHDNLATSKTSTNKNTLAQDNNHITQRTLNGKKCCAQDDNHTRSQSLTGKKTQVQDGKITTSRYVGSKKSHVVDDNLAKSKTVRNEKSQVRDHDYAKPRSPTDKKSQVEDNNLAVSKTLVDDNLATSRFLRCKKVQGNNLLASRTLKSKKSQPQEKNPTPSRILSGKKSSAEDNLAKSQFLRSKNCEAKIAGSKKLQIQDNNLATSRTLRTEKSPSQNDKPRSLVGSKKSQVDDDNLATPRTVRNEKSQTRDDNLAKSRTVGNKKSQVKDDSLATSRNLRTEKTHVHDNKLVISKSVVGSKKTQGQNDNVTTSRILNSKNIHGQNDNVATLRTLRSKKVQDTVTLRSKKSYTRQTTEIKTNKEEGIVILHKNKKRRKDLDNHNVSFKQSSPPVKVTRNTVNVNKPLSNRVDKENNYLEEKSSDQKEKKTSKDSNKNKTIPVEEGKEDKSTPSVLVKSAKAGSQMEQPSKPESKRIDRIVLALQNIQKRKQERLNMNLAANATQLTNHRVRENPKSIQNNENNTIYITRTSKRIELRKQKLKAKERINNSKEKINFNNKEVVQSLKEHVKYVDIKDTKVNGLHKERVHFHVDNMSQETSEAGSRMGKRKLSNEIRTDDEHDKVPKKTKKSSFSKQHDLDEPSSSSSGKNEDQNGSSSEDKPRTGQTLLNSRKDMLSEASKKKNIHLGKLIMENPETYQTKGSIEKTLVKYATRSSMQGLFSVSEENELGRIGRLVKDTLGTYWTKDNIFAKHGTRKSTRLSINEKKINFLSENKKKTTSLSPKPKVPTRKVISKHVRKNHSNVLSNKKLTLVKDGKGRNIKAKRDVRKKTSSDKVKNTNLDSSKSKVATKTAASKHVEKKQSKVVAANRTKGTVKVSLINVIKKDKMKETNLDSGKPKVRTKKVISKHVRKDHTKVQCNKNHVLAKRGTKNSMEALVNISKADLLNNERKEDAWTLAGLLSKNLGTYWIEDDREKRRTRRSLAAKKVISKHVRKNHSTLVSNRDQAFVKHGERENIKVSVNDSKEKVLNDERKSTSFDSNKSKALIKAIPPAHFMKDPTNAAGPSDTTIVKCGTQGNVKGLLKASKENTSCDEKKKTRSDASKSSKYRRSLNKNKNKTKTSNKIKWLNLSYERLRAYVYLRTLSMSTFKP